MKYSRQWLLLVFVLGNGNWMTSAPIYDGKEARTVPLFEEKEDSPIDLLTETGRLSGRKIL